MLVSESIKIYDTIDIHEIKEVLEQLIQVPDETIKCKIIEEYVYYLRQHLTIGNNEIKVFTAQINGVPYGIASCHVNPSYTSYGRKCGTIGWFKAKNIETSKELIKKCESYFQKQNMHKVRCGVNFPKSLGGVGFQVCGFDEEMLYGVAFSSREMREVKYLQQLGYFIECDYTCLRVSSKTWEKGRTTGNNVRFEYVSLNEAIEKQEEIHKLATDSFQGLLPDTSGGRFSEFIRAFKEMPKSKNTLNKNIELNGITSNEAFLDAWETSDLKNITPLMPMAYDKQSGDLIGVLLGLPDLYQHWKGRKITRVNVDTAIVRKDCKGRGIFSALNNIGQLTCSLYGMTYFEGTTVWTGNSRGVNNTDAIHSIMPHCIPIRKHVVLQKRLR